MRIKMRRHQLTIAVILTSAAFIANGSVSAQPVPENSEIRSADARPLISVRLEVRAKEAALVIPICGGDQETHSLCAGAATLQAFSHGAWRAARVRRGLAATLGMLPKDTWKAQRIDVGDTAYFDFTFSPELLDVQRGQKLRVVVDSWTSEAAMRGKDDPDKRLTSPIVDCP